MASIDQKTATSTVRDEAPSWLGLRLKPPGGPKEKAMAASAALVLLIGGFLAEQGFSVAADAVFPDAAAERAEAIQANINGKVESIEALSGKIYARLDGMDGEAAAAFEDDARSLMAAIESLRPDILAAKSVSEDAARRFAGAKQRELASAGFSTQSDFQIASGGGATVCRDGYVFGAHLDSVGNVLARIAGPEGASSLQRLDPGDGVKVDTAAGRVQVVLQDRDVNGSGLLGFSVNCP